MNKKTKIQNNILFFTLLILVIIVGWLFIKRKTLLNEKWKTYTNKKYNYSIDYPPDTYFNSPNNEGAIILYQVNPTVKKNL
jgi:hypothetical protein